MSTTYNSSIWITDGTSAGTHSISSIPSLTITGGFMPSGSNLYFVASTPTNGTELYMTDTTTGSAAIVKDIYPGTSGSYPIGFISDNSGGFYFRATNAVAGDELWHTDGTSGGTVMVKDIYPGSLGSAIQSLAFINNIFLFMAEITPTMDPNYGGAMVRRLALIF